MKAKGNKKDVALAAPVEVPAEASKARRKAVEVPPLNLQVASVLIRNMEGSPLVENRFSSRSKDKIVETQREGSTARGKKTQGKKDFEKLCEEAAHTSVEGWYGIPCTAFRNAMISACRTCDFVMTRAKCAVFVQADGLGTDGTPLVKIIGIHGEPKTLNGHPSVAHLKSPEYEMLLAPSRNANGHVDVHPRPSWKEWRALVRIEFAADMLKLSDVVNLLQRAGRLIGVQDGRWCSKESNGMGWGCFEIVSG